MPKFTHAAAPDVVFEPEKHYDDVDVSAEWYTPSRAAKILGCSPDVVRQLADDGVLDSRTHPRYGLQVSGLDLADFANEAVELKPVRATSDKKPSKETVEASDETEEKEPEAEVTVNPEELDQMLAERLRDRIRERIDSGLSHPSVLEAIKRFLIEGRI